MHASSNITGKKRKKQVSPRRARGNHGGKTETMPRQRSYPDNSSRYRANVLGTRAGMVNKDGVIPYLGFPCVEARRKKTTCNGQHTVQHTFNSYITCTRSRQRLIGIPSTRANRRGSVEADVVVVVEVVVHAPVVEVVVHGLVDGSRSLGVVVLRSSASVVDHVSVDARGSSRSSLYSPISSMTHGRRGWSARRRKRQQHS